MKASEAIRIIEALIGLYRNSDAAKRKETAEAVITIIGKIKGQMEDAAEKKALDDYLALPSVNAEIERIDYDADLRKSATPAPLGANPGGL